ncbi:hypothetical protein RND71_009798 [Anisodus tanguticus]|uniref:Uncharacterized protein n=1 Tax=Anisodus tanguticus TaxID=243964 RepID=A0AAE1SJ50_9SOLA|nr:hypothetical protein RND71_009798 [Anisodus tanguticus]
MATPATGQLSLVAGQPPPLDSETQFPPIVQTIYNANTVKHKDKRGINNDNHGDNNNEASSTVMVHNKFDALDKVEENENNDQNQDNVEIVNEKGSDHEKQNDEVNSESSNGHNIIGKGEVESSSTLSGMEQSFVEKQNWVNKENTVPKSRADRVEEGAEEGEIIKDSNVEANLIYEKIQV